MPAVCEPMLVIDTDSKNEDDDSCYPHMPISMLAIYCLLFGNGYLGRGLT